MFVLTVDQRDSRRGVDLVDDLLPRLNRSRIGRAPLRSFERTAGDEVQGVMADPGLVVALIRELQRDGRWSTGVGCGDVRRPLPPSARAGTGLAFERARDAVERAKAIPEHIAVEGRPPAAADAEAALRLLAAVLRRRTRAGWEATDALSAGHTRAEAATVLGVTKQAMSQRLRSAGWDLERAALPMVERLLLAADDDAGHAKDLGDLA